MSWEGGLIGTASVTRQKRNRGSDCDEVFVNFKGKARDYDSSVRKGDDPKRSGLQSQTKKYSREVYKHVNRKKGDEK